MLVTRDKNIADRERLLRELILYFKKKKVPYSDFLKYLEEAYKFKLVEKPEEISIPVAVFDNNYLSALETVVKYLRENKDMRLSEIAKLLARDQRAIGVTYRFASKKMKIRLKLKTTVSKYSLPVSVIADRKMSVLESIVYYLKKTYDLSYHDIAVLLKRDDRTIWTVYQRALRKKSLLK